MMTNKIKHLLFLGLLYILAATPTFAMTSANFSLSGDLNSGGGTRSSAIYTMAVDALGISSGGGTSSSPQYALQSGSLYVLADQYILDTIPDPFAFVDQTNVPLDTLITSNGITVSGINAAAPLSVTGGTYDINGSGIWTSASGTVNNGDAVRLTQSSSTAYATTTTAVLTIGGVNGSFNVTTMAVPVATYVMIPGTLPSYYGSIQTAFNNAADGKTVMVQALEFTEELVFGNAASIVLSGGYDAGFSSAAGTTTVRGSLTITDGMITIGEGGFIIR